VRLWSLHPGYLDAKGLVALWREALLAQAVLLGNTKGYRHHPQVRRFKACRDPVAVISTYLWWVYAEAERRDYSFDAGRIAQAKGRQRLVVKRGELKYELAHLRHKLWSRDRQSYRNLKLVRLPKPHPMFHMKPGGIESWETL